MIYFTISFDKLTTLHGFSKLNKQKTNPDAKFKTNLFPFLTKTKTTLHTSQIFTLATSHCSANRKRGHASDSSYYCDSQPMHMFCYFSRLRLNGFSKELFCRDQIISIGLNQSRLLVPKATVVRVSYHIYITTDRTQSQGPLL